MSLISITQVDKTYTLDSIYIQNIFIDIQNNSISIEVNLVDILGHIVDKLTLIAIGEDYDNIYNGNAMKEFVLRSLNVTEILP